MEICAHDYCFTMGLGGWLDPGLQGECPADPDILIGPKVPIVIATVQADGITGPLLNPAWAKQLTSVAVAAGVGGQIANSFIKVHWASKASSRRCPSGSTARRRCRRSRRLSVRSLRDGVRRLKTRHGVCQFSNPAAIVTCFGAKRPPQPLFAL